MRLLPVTAAALTLAALSAPAVAQQSPITVSDAYVRAMGASATSGALYMTIQNDSDREDHLLSVSTDASEDAEMHTSKMEDSGLMRMLAVPDGFDLKANGTLSLAPGGNHVMLFDLTRPLADGDTVSVTLMFEQAGEVDLDVPVDNGRKPGGMTGMKDVGN